MKNCEHYEMLVSTLIDGALDRAEQIECFDHVVRCRSCREFYLDARALDGLVAAVRTPAEAEAPSPELWKRIDWLTRKDRRASAGRRIPIWAMQAAAVLVIAFGLSVAMWNRADVSAPEQAEVLLGQSADMTEERFVELTKEVMRSDRRYHSAMYEIMGQVVRDTTTKGETSPEDIIQRRDEGSDGESAESSRRIPA